jgi:hypothetical protein
MLQLQAMMIEFDTIISIWPNARFTAGSDEKQRMWLG